jgi:hypothetical protein
MSRNVTTLFLYYPPLPGTVEPHQCLANIFHTPYYYYYYRLSTIEPINLGQQAKYATILKLLCPSLIPSASVKLWILDSLKHQAHVPHSNPRLKRPSYRPNVHLYLSRRGQVVLLLLPQQVSPRLGSISDLG